MRHTTPNKKFIAFTVCVILLLQGSWGVGGASFEPGVQPDIQGSAKLTALSASAFEPGVKPDIQGSAKLTALSASAFEPGVKPDTSGFVKLRESNEVRRTADTPELADLTDDQLELISGNTKAPHEGYIVSLKRDYSAFSLMEQKDDDVEVLTDSLYVVPDLEKAFELSDVGEIRFIQPNYYYTLLGDEIDAVNDPRFSQQWALKEYPGINAISAWRRGLRGRGAKIAVIDSGVNRNHEDLAGANITGYSTFDLTGNTPDSSGHGTFVTGVIAAQTNNSVGVAGIADKSEIFMIKAFNNNSATLGEVVMAVYKAVAEEADVINMSLGATQSAMNDTVLKEAVDNAISHGAIVIAAVGNYNKSFGEEGKKWESIPAKFENVIGVGSVGVSAGLPVVSDFSQRNNVTVVAPGENITGLTRTGGYVTGNQGTSYAAPVVAAMAGIAKSVSKSITKAGFETLLRISSINYVTPGGYDVNIGYGLVDMDRFTDYLTTKYAIAYHMMGGITASPEYYYLSDNDVVLLPAVRGGYSFLGWYTAADYSGVPVEKIAKGSIFSREYYAKWLKEPAVTAGNENQTGSAAPASTGGSVTAVPYSVDVSAWFEGEPGIVLSYNIYSSNGAGVGKIDGSKLSYTPARTDAGKTIKLVIQAGYAGVYSGEIVNVDITVGNIPADTTVGGNGGGSGGSSGGGGGSSSGGSGSKSPNSPVVTEIKTPTNAGITSGGIVGNTTGPTFQLSNDESKQSVDAVFGDMTQGSWYYEAVQFVFDKGYFKGTAVNLFSPNESMTRGMFITALGRLEGISEADYKGNQGIFADVAVWDWFAPYVTWGYGRKIIQGMGDGRFNPMEPVRRDQMAVMVYNYLRSEGYVTREAVSALNYNDAVLIPDWAESAMKWMTENEILQGNTDGRIEPYAFARRCETAVIFQRIYSFMEAADGAKSV